MPLLGAPAVNQAFQFLAGNRALLPAAIWMMLVAGFAEETIWRGFLFERLGRAVRSGAPAKGGDRASDLGAVRPGPLPGAGTCRARSRRRSSGCCSATIYAASGRLFMLMVAHAAFDLTALAIIYWRLETAIAELAFK